MQCLVIRCWYWYTAISVLFTYKNSSVFQSFGSEGSAKDEEMTWIQRRLEHKCFMFQHPRSIRLTFRFVPNP